VKDAENSHGSADAKSDGGNNEPGQNLVSAKIVESCFQIKQIHGICAGSADYCKSGISGAQGGMDWVNPLPTDFLSSTIRPSTM